MPLPSVVSTAQAATPLSPSAAPGEFARILDGFKKPRTDVPRDVTSARPSVADQAHAWADAVRSAQTRLDDVLRLARTGKSFRPAELIALQAQAYRASQELDLATRVVEKASAGAKQVLQTQL